MQVPTSSTSIINLLDLDDEEKSQQDAMKPKRANDLDESLTPEETLEGDTSPAKKKPRVQKLRAQTSVKKSIVVPRSSTTRVASSAAPVAASPVK